MIDQFYIAKLSLVNTKSICGYQKRPLKGSRCPRGGGVNWANLFFHEIKTYHFDGGKTSLHTFWTAHNDTMPKHQINLVKLEPLYIANPS